MMSNKHSSVEEFLYLYADHVWLLRIDRMKLKIKL